MKIICAMLATGIAGCAPVEHVAPARPSAEDSREHPAVCRLQSPQIAGSLIPLGDGRALTARHLFRQPVIDIDGERSGVDVVAEGSGEEVSAGDWIILKVNDAVLPAPDVLVRDFSFAEGSPVFLCGFPTTHKDSRLPTLVRALVHPPPPWITAESDLVYLQAAGLPDLSGMSGGAAVIPDESGVGWCVVGMYLGRWQSAGWTGYIVRPLPPEAFGGSEAGERELGS